ncbi:sodium:glutamate symporter [Pontibacillus halophilus JSM 076056 = DSM 19796]|uniref:Sodium:glutamate symporter n=1 Tax=Pontibacillus halophilus JSM 076056 = DSM 19796 TaxID=1385510 RepID=A0A0A5GMF3_9BACI|nr:sodium/glutamate symporter [Pontibacillus halophilus]KGX92403.1 sodium:glutamate symporter [Pontibacillus halophilus JSM 076056 = DSM 19796]
MSPEEIGFALLYIGVFLIIGKLIRVKVALFQNLFLPASIIGGFIALLLGPQVLGKLVTPFVSEGHFLTNGIMTDAITQVWAALPGLMINVVFASLFLGASMPGLKDIWKYGGPQLAFGWAIGWGQYVIGLVVVLFILGPLFDIPVMAGALIEVAFEGGHGTAAGMASTFEELGFSEAFDLAIGLATVGVLSGVIFGIILINWAVRNNKTEVIKDIEGFSELRKRGIMDYQNREPAGKMTLRPESIEPLSFHLAIIMIAILIGWGILQGLIGLESITIANWTGSSFMQYIPLFPIAMFGGIILQSFFNRNDKYNLVDRRMINRIQGLALDVLIISAIATVSLEVIGDYLVPFLVLAVAGISWNLFGFIYLASRIIPNYWFERGIGDFGQSMGVTATGLLLMRIVDPDNESPAFEAFGYKQLVYEPFLGGGLVTALSVPFIAGAGPWIGLILALSMTALGALFGIFYFGKGKHKG